MFINNYTGPGVIWLFGLWQAAVSPFFSPLTAQNTQDSEELLTCLVQVYLEDICLCQGNSMNFH